MATADGPSRRGRPHSLPAEEKAQIVLKILAGEESVKQAAERAQVSQQSIWTWRRRFIEAGHLGLIGEVIQKLPEGEADEQRQLTELKIALGEVYLELFRLRSQTTDT